MSPSDASSAPDEVDLGRAAEKWDTFAEHGRKQRLWQEFPMIRRHVNRKICGEPVENYNRGLILQLSGWLRGAPAGRGISVGCGRAVQELTLLKEGLVERFDLFDISPKMRELATSAAHDLGLRDRVTISGENAFEVATGPYDLVHWHNALHHMPDTRAALEWSHDVLANGGTLCMREYTGPNRFGWTPRQLELANRFRRALPPRFRRIPDEPDRLRAPAVRKIDPQTVIDDDPSESIDSESICPALREVFPGAWIRPLGGIVYYIGFTHMLVNFDEERDQWWLRMALVADDYCIELGESIHAAALAVKEPRAAG